MTRRTIIRAVAMAAILSSAPFALSRRSGIAPSDACAQVKLPPGTGTCCVQQEAVCVTPTGNLPARYFKQGGGPCP